MFCPKHMPDGTDTDCGACGGYRKYRARWDTEHTNDTRDVIAEFWGDIRDAKCCDDCGLNDGPGNFVVRCTNHDWSVLDA